MTYTPGTPVATAVIARKIMLDKHEKIYEDLIMKKASNMSRNEYSGKSRRIPHSI